MYQCTIQIVCFTFPQIFSLTFPLPFHIRSHSLFFHFFIFFFVEFSSLFFCLVFNSVCNAVYYNFSQFSHSISIYFRFLFTVVPGFGVFFSFHSIRNFVFVFLLVMSQKFIQTGWLSCFSHIFHH